MTDNLSPILPTFTEKSDFIITCGLRVLKEFPMAPPNHVHDVLAECFAKDFSADDAVRYTKCTEEVNPDLDEDTALTRMAEICKKYGRNYDQ